ncbi:hypothetical protein AGMMS49990_06580 [Endomicrobiia bacterium]|nr:hypothetical protein AGMMS49990_06580 [Endomicrobiia bacterium]
MQNGIGFREVKEIKIKELNEKLLLLFLPLMLMLNSCVSFSYSCVDRKEELYRKEMKMIEDSYQEEVEMMEEPYRRETKGMKNRSPKNLKRKEELHRKEMEIKEGVISQRYEKHGRKLLKSQGSEKFE